MAPRRNDPMDPLVLVLAVARNGALGKDGKVPWHIPEDMKHFKNMTMGHAILMGRKTYEETRRPLPGRRNIVISRQADFTAPGAELAGSLAQALQFAADAETAFIIGGEQIYRQAMETADRMEITEVDLEPEGDAWFPVIDAGCWQETARAAGQGYAFVTYRHT